MAAEHGQLLGVGRQSLVGGAWRLFVGVFRGGEGGRITRKWDPGKCSRLLVVTTEKAGRIRRSLLCAFKMVLKR